MKCTPFFSFFVLLALLAVSCCPEDTCGEGQVAPDSSDTDAPHVARDEESGIASISMQGGFSWTCDQGGGQLIIIDGIIPQQTEDFSTSPCASVEETLSVELIQPDCGDDSLHRRAGGGLT